MGFFSNLFHKTPDYPELDTSSPAAARLKDIQEQLKQLADDVSDPLEIVPAEHAAYVFLGNPPKHFGLAWIHDGKVSGLNTLIKEHGVAPADIEKLVVELRTAYEKHQDDAHFTTKIGDRTVVVTPSPELEKEVHAIMEHRLH